ncbi:MAG: PEP-CTERM sorting domain-containing protein [Terriglobia bacterium]
MSIHGLAANIGGYDTGAPTNTWDGSLTVTSGQGTAEFVTGTPINETVTGYSISGITIDGAHAYVELASGDNSNSALTTLAVNHGALNLMDGAAVNTSGPFTNSGYVEIDSQASGGSSLAVGGAYTQTGPTTDVDGTLISPNTDVNGTLISPNVNIEGGTLSGTGTVQGAVTIASGATLSPGDAPGTLSVLGSLDLAGTLDESIDSGSSFDVTDISGQLTLGPGSVLDVLLYPGYEPSLGTSFVIMDFGSLAPGSQFGSISDRLFGASEEWKLTYNSTDIVLTLSTTPEPASFLLFGTGLLFVFGYGLRRKKLA